jgi:hypothetical protein
MTNKAKISFNMTHALYAAKGGQYINQKADDVELFLECFEEVEKIIEG